MDCAAAGSGPIPTNASTSRARNLISLLLSMVRSGAQAFSRRRDLRRVVLGVVGRPAGEELDGHRSALGVTTGALPVRIRKCSQEAGDLFVLGDDHVEYLAEGLWLLEVGAADGAVVV